MSAVHGVAPGRRDHVEPPVGGRRPVGVQRHHQTCADALAEPSACVDAGSPRLSVLVLRVIRTCGAERPQPLPDGLGEAEVDRGLGDAAVRGRAGRVAGLRETTGRDRSVDLRRVVVVAELVTRVERDGDPAQRLGSAGGAGFGPGLVGVGVTAGVRVAAGVFGAVGVGVGVAAAVPSALGASGAGSVRSATLGSAVPATVTATTTISARSSDLMHPAPSSSGPPGERGGPEHARPVGHGYHDRLRTASSTHIPESPTPVCQRARPQMARAAADRRQR